MTVSKRISAMKCPVFSVADIIGKKWAIVILQEVGLNGGKGFNYVFERVGKITPKLLSARLKDFEKHGLVKKEVLANVMPVRTKYLITKKGRELNDIITVMKQWCAKYDSSLCDCAGHECVKCPLF